MDSTGFQSEAVLCPAKQQREGAAQGPIPASIGCTPSMIRVQSFEEGAYSHLNQTSLWTQKWDGTKMAHPCCDFMVTSGPVRWIHPPQMMVAFPWKRFSPLRLALSFGQPSLSTSRLRDRKRERCMQPNSYRGLWISKSLVHPLFSCHSADMWGEEMCPTKPTSSHSHRPLLTSRMRLPAVWRPMQPH